MSITPASIPSGRVEGEKGLFLFVAPDPEVLEGLLADQADPDGILAVPHASVPATDRGMDAYYDTSDWKILRSGHSLRFRTVARRAEASLIPLTTVEKTPLLRRALQQPVSEASVADLFSGNGPIGDRLRMICDPEELQVRLRIPSILRVYALRRRGEMIGTLVLKRAILGLAGREPRIEPQVEIEVPSEQTVRVTGFAARLSASGSLVAAARTEFETALQALGLGPIRPRDLPGTELDGSMSLGVFATHVLRRQCASMVWHEPGTRLGEDSEHLHDMRVATRRMRAALRLFAPVWPSAEVERFRARLRECAQTLGEVRDLDVQIQQIESWRGRLLTIPPEALDPLIQHFCVTRYQARRKILRLLDADRYRRLKESIERRLEKGPGRHAAASLPARAAGPYLIRSARTKAMRCGRKLTATSAPAEYHQLRIRCKRLRYVLEFFEPVYGAPARGLIERLVAVQDILGLHQDAQVALAGFSRLTQDPAAGLPEPARVALAEMAQLYAARAERLRAQLPAALSRLRGKRWRRLRAVMRCSDGEMAADLLRPTKSGAKSGTRSDVGSGAGSGAEGGSELRRHTQWIRGGVDQRAAPKERASGRPGAKGRRVQESDSGGSVSWTS